jgi:hypothetical protein
MSAHISQHCNPSDNHQHCNATGSYSSFAGNDPNTPFRDLVDAKNITVGGTFGQDLSVGRITNPGRSTVNRVCGLTV